MTPAAPDRARRRLLIAVLLCGGTALRLGVASLGWNYDLESYWIVANLVEEGRNVWAYTIRANYGPVWPGLLWLLFRLHAALGWSSLSAFHVLVALVPTAADLAIALWLGRRRRWDAAAIFYLCPVSILVTGHQSQIDSVAIALALWSWDRAENRLDAAERGSLLWPGVLLGVSLATKHLFALFPLWILMRPGPLTPRLAYAGTAVGVFLAAFAPFVLTPSGWNGVISHVFLYRGDSWFGNGLLPALLPVASLWIPAALLAMLVAGRVVATRAPRELFLAYPVMLVATAPTMAEQYLAIPLVAAAAHWRRWTMPAFMLVGTTTLLAAKGRTCGIPALEIAADHLGAAGFLLSGAGQSSLYPQICLCLFLAGWGGTALLRHAAATRLHWKPRWSVAAFALFVAVIGGVTAVRLRGGAAASSLRDAPWAQLVQDAAAGNDPMPVAIELRRRLAERPGDYLGTSLLALALDRAGLFEDARPHWEWLVSAADRHGDASTGAEARKRLTPPWISDRALIRNGLRVLRVLRDTGDNGVAAVYFQAVLDRTPTDPAPARLIAQALDDAGRPLDARPYWDRARALSAPGGASAAKRHPND